MTTDMNINMVGCLRTKSHFGYDMIHNICTDTVTRLDWTFGDWASLAFLLALVLLVIGGVSFLIWDARRW